MGYTSIWQQRISRPVAENFVCSQKKPFYIRGQQCRSGSGHAWVIDGWKAYDICHWLVTYDTRIKPGDGSVGVEPYRNLLRREEICKAIAISVGMVYAMVTIHSGYTIRLVLCRPAMQINRLETK